MKVLFYILIDYAFIYFAINYLNQEKMEKIYISIPITNLEDSVRTRCEDSLNDIKKRNLPYEVVCPIEDEEGFENQITIEHDYAYFMGEDIKLLLRCQAIYMSKGWEKSKGCRAEHELAKIYGLDIFYQI
jgi:hypothetical protein